MGGAEGTKLDLDFMDMERVSKLSREFEKKKDQFNHMSNCWINEIRSIETIFIFVSFVK